ATPCAPRRLATSLPPCRAVAFSVSVDTARQCYKPSDGAGPERGLRRSVSVRTALARGGRGEAPLRRRGPARWPGGPDAPRQPHLELHVPAPDRRAERSKPSLRGPRP